MNSSPVGPFANSADLVPSQKITIGENAEHLLVVIKNRQSANPICQHHISGWRQLRWGAKYRADDCPVAFLHIVINAVTEL